MLVSIEFDEERSISTVTGIPPHRFPTDYQGKAVAILL